MKNNKVGAEIPEGAQLAELIAAIYDAGMKPEQWPQVLQGAMATFDAQLAMLWTHDFATNSMFLPNAQLSCMVGDAACVRDFREHYHSVNIWVPRSAYLEEGDTVLSSELYPERQLRSTEFYGGWLRPYDLHHAIGSSVLKEESRQVKLSFVRPWAAGAFRPTERRRLAFLLPHIRNAFLIHRQLGHVQELARSLREALDELSIGVVLLRRDGKVFHANTAAVAAVERTRALSLAGQVTCTVPSQMPLLQKLILDAAETGAGSGLRSGGAMKIHGFAGDLQVVITPLKFGKALDSASAVMFCSVPGETPRGVAQLLRQLHQLTPAEAAVAACLIDGMSVKEIADARGITTNTLRTQLKSIFQKTGARSQADLMRLLLGALPLLQGAAGSADS